MTRYAHADQLMVSPGDQAEAGQTIATSTATGYAGAAHLHFEVLENGARVNPMAAMSEQLIAAKNT